MLLVQSIDQLFSLTLHSRLPPSLVVLSGFPITRLLIKRIVKIKLPVNANVFAATAHSYTFKSLGENFRLIHRSWYYLWPLILPRLLLSYYHHMNYTFLGRWTEHNCFLAASSHWLFGKLASAPLMPKKRKTRVQKVKPTAQLSRQRCAMRPVLGTVVNLVRRFL